MYEYYHYLWVSTQEFIGMMLAPSPWLWLPSPTPTLRNLGPTTSCPCIYCSVIGDSDLLCCTPVPLWEMATNYSTVLISSSFCLWFTGSILPEFSYISTFPSSFLFSEVVIQLGSLVTVWFLPGIPRPRECFLKSMYRYVKVHSLFYTFLWVLVNA